MARKDAKSKVDQQTITLNYIKSNNFRVIHVDGCYGGISPHGNISMSMFSERQPIPREVTHKFVDGNLGDIVETVGREGVVREMEVNALMDLSTAKVIYKWLGDKIEAADLVITEAIAAQGKEER